MASLEPAAHSASWRAVQTPFTPPPQPQTHTLLMSLLMNLLMNPFSPLSKREKQMFFYFIEKLRLRVKLTAQSHGALWGELNSSL